MQSCTFKYISTAPSDQLCNCSCADSTSGTNSGISISIELSLSLSRQLLILVLPLSSRVGRLVSTSGVHLRCSQLTVHSSHIDSTRLDSPHVAAFVEVALALEDVAHELGVDVVVRVEHVHVEHGGAARDAARDTGAARAGGRQSGREEHQVAAQAERGVRDEHAAPGRQGEGGGRGERDGEGVALAAPLGAEPSGGGGALGLAQDPPGARAARPQGRAPGAGGRRPGVLPGRADGRHGRREAVHQNAQEGAAREAGARVRHRDPPGWHHE